MEKADSSFPAASDEHVTDGDDDVIEEDDDIPLSILKLSNDHFGFGQTRPES